MSAESRPQPSELRLRVVAAALTLTALFGCADKSDGFSGGCETFGVYAQNRWQPLGTAIRKKPNVRAEKIGGFAPNEVIAVDGWIGTGEPVYPTNTPPWNSDRWFHLSYGKGWVSFAGVRAVPTSPDFTGYSEDGGQPAPTTPECEGNYKPS